MDKGNLAVKVLTCALVVFFGTGSWVAINGIWVELPLLVSLGIPEGYGLASYIIIITQLANVGPLAFTIVNYFTPKEVKLEGPTVCLITTIGWITCLLLVFFWDSYTIWAGELHSTAFLILCLFLAIVDCTSSVTFTPFMARLRSFYLTWYFVGEGMSALIPGIVALVQGVQTDGSCVSNYTFLNTTGNTTLNCTDWVAESAPARFGPSEFFVFLCAMMVLSFSGFLLLNIVPVIKRGEYTQDAPSQSSVDTATSSTESHNMLVASLKEDNTTKEDLTESTDPSSPQQVRGRPLGDFIYLFVILGIVNALSNGILPSIQSYSAGAYSLTTYLYAATLGNISNPVACFVVMLMPFESLLVVGITAAAGILAGSYCLWTAAASPDPPLEDHAMGGVLVVIAWMCVVGLFSYTKATIGWILRQEPNKRSLLIWFGAITQVGSLAGALIMFPIVTFTPVFQAPNHDPCAGKEPCVPVVYPTDSGLQDYLV